MKGYLLALAVVIISGTPGIAAEKPATPKFDGDWWTIAGHPYLGDPNTPWQQVVDFGIWQADDGSWQLWSCIRGTAEAGKTRVFHRWEGARLTDTNWAAKGVVLRADPALGERAGGLQAPHVIRHEGKHLMFYGDWSDICLATSADGKTFTRALGSDGRPQLHFAGADDLGRNTRDPMVLKAGDRWYCYYTGHSPEKGANYARWSDDLTKWSPEKVVAAGGASGDGPYSAECPFVVEPESGHFYLFRTQEYGEHARTMVYHSTDPLDFGINNDAGHYITTLPVAAPEIFKHEGQWFMAALMPNLRGIRIVRLEWATGG